MPKNHLLTNLKPFYKSVLGLLISFFILSGCQKVVISLDKVKIETREVLPYGNKMLNHIYLKCTGIIVDRNSYQASIKRGFCISTHSNPTVNDLKTEDFEANNIGKFYETVYEGLLSNTTYYIRAYVEYNGEVKYGNELTYTTMELYPHIIGETYLGGIIGYISQPNDSLYVQGEFHGLIVSSINNSENIDWAGYNTSGTTIQTKDEIGAGAQNTFDIVSYYGNGNTYAAALCYNLTMNGYSDWFLPSKDELFNIIKNYYVLDNFNYNDVYWSSSLTSTASNNSAWGCYVYYQDPYCASQETNYSECVRAVRYF